MNDSYITHYFEKAYGPFLSICDLESDARNEVIEYERGLTRGFNRFDEGQAFFDFRRLADDLTLELYRERFDREPIRRPYFAVLGEADVVGGLYREPCKIRIPLSFFKEGEVTFMCPDHFHLVSYNNIKCKKYFGYQIPDDYTEEKYPYFGKIFSFADLERDFENLRLGEYLEEKRASHDWYRYIEAQIWMDRLDLESCVSEWESVAPESWNV